MITFGSVCSGIEAASVAWKPLGWKAEWLAEIEPFPSALLAHHYPNIPNLGDMTKIADWISQGFVSAPDVLVGGTPCQAFSIAGLRGGLVDPRGGLTLEYVRILDALDSVRERPAVGLWENVPGVLSSKDNAFGCFLGALVGEDCELVPSGKKWTNAGIVYGPKRTVAWRVLDAQYFGVAQRRKRVFVVASAGNFDPSEILFEFDGLRRDTPPSREAGKGVAECFEPRSPDGHARVTGSVVPTLNTASGGQRTPCVFHSAEVVGALCHSDHKGVGNQYVSDGKCVVTTYPIHDKATRHGGERGVSNGLGIGQPTDPCPTLDTGGNHAVAIQGSMIGREDKNGPQGDGLNEEVSFTLNCVDRHAVAFDAYNQTTDSVFMTLRADKADNEHIPTVYSPTMQVRRLTPVECEKLQGFPDQWTDIPYRNKPASDSPRYKALGNSMAVPVIHWLGQRIQKGFDK